MRAVIFTLDSIFALIIAAAGISLLAYFFYSPQTTTILGYSSAASILQNLLSTNSSSVSSSNFLFNNLAYQANASSEVWDMFQKDNMNNAGNNHGPLTPAVSFINYAVHSTAIGPVIDYGKLFYASGNVLYAVNASNGKRVWSKSIFTSLQQTPIIAQGKLIYVNSTNMTAINPNTNSVIWSTNIVGLAYGGPGPIAYDGKLYFGAQSASVKGVYAYYLNNGTQAWSYDLSGQHAEDLAIDSGSIVATSNPRIALLNDFGTSGNAIWTKSISTAAGSATSNYNSLIASILAGSANALYINGTQAPGFPIGIVSTYTYPTVYNGVMIYQSYNAILAIPVNGGTGWISSVPSAYGVAHNFAVPIASSKLVYSAWGNGYILAQNITNGNTVWVTNVPYSGALSLSGLAYGRLYASVGSNIIAYGTCGTGGGGSILYLAATMYANGQGSCADALVDNIYPMTNYSIFLNNSFAPALSLASFNGLGSYIENPTKAPVNGLQTFTISAWIYPTNTANGPFIYSEGSPALSMDFGITSGNALTVSTTNSGSPKAFTSSLSVPLNKWSFVTAELSVGGTSGTFVLSLNGQLQSGPGQPESTAGAMFSGIGYSVGNTVGQSGSFFSGNIANVQIYNATLSQSQILQIYQRGLQGGPLQNVGIQAWYPLAGDSNDYSGLGNTAYPFGVSYLPSNYLPAGYTNSYQVSTAGITLPIQNYTTGLSRFYKVSVVSWR